MDGLSFATAEHFMMWRKAMLFGDGETAERVLSAGPPKAAKDLGRGFANFDTGVWERRRYDIVVAGNAAKFGQHEDLRQYLRATGERGLVEASSLDAVWGIGLAADHPDAAHPERWPHTNLLGKALMDVRTLLRQALG